MGQLSSKLRRFTSTDGEYGEGYSHWCPACEEMHAFAVEKPFFNGAHWKFDGNVDSPSFEPSMNIRIGPYPSDSEGNAGRIDVCHYFLKGGVIQYLTDCTHNMAGQKVPLPDLPIRHWDIANIPVSELPPIDP